MNDDSGTQIKILATIKRQKISRKSPRHTPFFLMKRNEKFTINMVPMESIKPIKWAMTCHQEEAACPAFISDQAVAAVELNLMV